MMQKKFPGISVATLLSDMVAVTLALIVAYFIRFHSGIIPVTKGYNPEDYVRLLPLVSLLWLIIMNLIGLHRSGSSIFDIDVLKKIVKSSVLALLIVVWVNFFLREASYSRLVFVIALVSTVVFVSIFRYILLSVVKRLLWQRGKGVMPLFIVGTGQMAEILYRRLVKRPMFYKVVGFLTTSSESEATTVYDMPIKGNYRDAPELAQRNKVSTIIVADPDLTNSELMKFFVHCSKHMIDVRIVPGILDIMLREASVTEVEGIPLLGMRETPLQGWNLIFKRLFDIVVTLPLLILLLPLFIVVGLFIKIDSPGPVFYLQERMGLDGRVFRMIKFRSMFYNAEDTTGPIFAQPDDTRCTRVGKVLRKLSIDELPQIINVLLGDMSLVGPRPERPFFVDKFKELLPDYMLRHRVKAGLTGWAQVNGFRGNTPITQRIKYDLYYIENWSLWFDIKIVLLTLFAHKNAY